MPPDPPPERYLTAVQRMGLRQLDVDWPDSRAFFSRLATALRAHADSEEAWTQRLRTLATAGLAAHRHALRGRQPEVQRFAAFVEALEGVLTGAERTYLAQALTAQQCRALNRTLQLVATRRAADSRDAG